MPFPPPLPTSKKKKKILNPLLCCLGIRNCESSPVFLGIRNSESTRVLFGRSAILDVLLCFCKGWHLLMNCRLCSLRIKKLEFLPVFYGELSSRDKKFRQSFERKNRRLLGRILWFLANGETFPVSFNTSLRLRVNWQQTKDWRWNSLSEWKKKVSLHWNFYYCLYRHYTRGGQQEKAYSYCLSRYEQSVR